MCNPKKNETSITRKESKGKTRGSKKKIRAYVAGALGFCESTRFFYKNVVLKTLADMEIEYFDPFEASAELLAALAMPAGEERSEKLLKCWKEMGEKNDEEIRKADVVIANLDGQELDGGTCSEIGFANSIGKTILAWRCDLRKHGEEGMVVNLQVEHFVVSSPGGCISTSFDELKERLLEFCRNFRA